MSQTLLTLCVGPEAVPSHDPHEAFSVLVFISSGESKRFKEGQNEFPVGTFIVKEKLEGLRTAKPAGLFTGMLKREPGYNPDGDDWEWFVVFGGPGVRQVIARGKLASCLDCHEKHRETGFITSRYP